MGKYDRMATGRDGEQWVSNNFDELGFTHNHHDFSSIQTYAKTQGVGVDLWGQNIYVEVKNYPHSELASESHYNLLVKPRFRDTPIDSIRIVVVIGGYVDSLIYTLCNRDNIYLIHVDNENHLHCKLEYYLNKVGVLSAKSKPHSIRPYMNYQRYSAEMPVYVLVLVSDGDVQDKGPPSSQNLANSGSLSSLGHPLTLLTSRG